ncbi:MAG: cold shock domain-containing protein [Synechococcales cyanobacterium M58_A2018_015]|nr:cold shock domain-containing protein [Synechococcales cyanobacterium M58_A2018_015]
MTPGFRRGTLIHWNDERGFGFIQPVDGSREVFLHITALKQSIQKSQIRPSTWQTAGRMGINCPALLKRYDFDSCAGSGPCRRR